jgi:hypothetical protein
MQPQHDRPLQDGQVAEATRPALLHPRAARLTPGTHDVGVSTFERYIKLFGAEHLTDNAEFGQTQSRFDTREIHAHGFLFPEEVFIQNFARNPVLVNERLSAPCHRPQTLTSNLAKSHVLKNGKIVLFLNKRI